MMMRKSFARMAALLLGALLLGALLPLSAQDIGTAVAGTSVAVIQAAETASRLQMALSSADYPVTAGDIYQLVFSQGGTTPITLDIQINGDYRFELEFIGAVEARGKTFLELKRFIEGKIAESYKRSMPSLTIVAPGAFLVTVTGEIQRTRYMSAWGMTRLSELLDGIEAPQASRRAVTIVSLEGERRSYDLQKALRLGELGQDPFVKPGDLVILGPAGRRVRVEGQVRQPGSYELAEGEGLHDLVYRFGGGLTAQANPTAVRVEGWGPEGRLSTNLMLPDEEIAAPDLRDGDLVFIPSSRDLHELLATSAAGAAGAGEAGAAPTAGAAAPGASSLALLSMVSVSGAAYRPGTFPFQPGLPPESYLGMAGGPDPERNWGGAYVHYDRRGKKKAAGSLVEVGDRLHFKTNSLQYHFERSLPIITSVMGIILNAYSIYDQWDAHANPEPVANG